MSEAGKSQEEPAAEGFSGSTLERRDPRQVRKGLESWLPRLCDGAAVVVSDLAVPSGAGFSNETYLFDACWSSAAGERRQRLVVQAAPLGDALFQRYDLARMFDLQQALAERGVPVPNMRGYEADAGALGAPFYVMDAIDALVPADSPSYMAEGFVFDAAPAERETLWWSAIEAMGKLHRIDPGDLTPSLRSQLGAGADPVEERIAFWEQFVAWASPDVLPLHAESIDWLRTHRPSARPPLSITWGDPKLGNVLFVEHRARALIDWELCGVGFAEEDLAEFLWMADYAGLSAGVPRLDGIPGRAETERRYRALLDRELHDMEWWSFFAVYRLSAICHRIMHQVRSLGGLPPDLDVGSVNPVTHFLREALEARR